MAGWWLPKIEARSATQAEGVAYVYSLSAPELRERIGQGFTVFYLPGIREFNDRVFGVDLAKFGAKPLLRDDES